MTQPDSNLSSRQTIVQELSRLTVKGGGTLTPIAVVDAARPPESPLHPCFEWDDSVAAEAYRQDQARALIRGVRIALTIEETTVVVPQYVHNTKLEDREQGYCPLLSIDDDDHKLRVISSEMRTGMAHLLRAGSIAKAIDNTRLHAALAREVKQIERYLETLLKPSTSPPPKKPSRKDDATGGVEPGVA